MTIITPQLVPLRVPWQISQSTPGLSFATEQVDGTNYGVVRFTGFLGQATKLVNKHGNYVQVTVLLEDLVFASFYPEFSEEDKQRLNSYDWSKVPEFRDAAGSLKGSTERFHAEWNDTDVCPEPAAYRILWSERLVSLGFQNDQFQHYLFVSDDFNVEAIAQKMNWELGNFHSSP